MTLLPRADCAMSHGPMVLMDGHVAPPHGRDADGPQPAQPAVADGNGTTVVRRLLSYSSPPVSNSQAVFPRFHAATVPPVRDTVFPLNLLLCVGFAPDVLPFLALAVLAPRPHLCASSFGRRWCVCVCVCDCVYALCVFVRVHSGGRGGVYVVTGVSSLTYGAAPLNFCRQVVTPLLTLAPLLRASSLRK